ncbi:MULTISPECIES: T9SS type A sorting domain-containing protein [Salegentibacter]|uniref:Por secretion system C-terminal sorting domain-containing protein n=1 Tax=Salegentibacter agarivorans TaxID=345907 RepID=A0A1I2N548_9FLAO|nr:MULTISPECIES: T9SS type A sorting domain-containing protein [Salegentibacter]MBO2545244.1 T9SS type A sorting domain-containing protein [Salegentibacter sp. BDJ18]SFF98220.1 Por secretion system C-terminal sorting domain-containing protein [Salegentibacter agarivorans]
MKKLLKNSLLLVVLVTGINMYAADRVEVSVDKGQTLIVELDNVSTVSLEDASGFILFKDSPALDGNYKKQIDFSRIPAGTYFLNTEDLNGIYTTEIKKSSTGISIEDKTAAVVFKPIYRVESKKVKFFLTNPAETNATLKVYDATGKLVGEVKGKGYTMNKTLDFSKMPKGEYTFTLNVADKTVTEKLSI